MITTRIRFAKSLCFFLFMLITVVNLPQKVYKDTSLPPYYVNLKSIKDKIKNINLSEIGKEITYIALETKPECLINHIYKVDLGKDYIFVSTSDRLLLFDIKGKFIRQIGSAGRGPAEYIRVRDFCIDVQKNEVLILSPPRLLVFGLDGKFKNSVSLDFRPAQIIQKDQNTLMYHMYNLSILDPENSVKVDSWILSDRQGKVIARIPNHLKRVSKPGISVPESPLYFFDNSVHFMEFGIDTLYYFDSNTQKPYAVFDLGKLKMNPDPVVPFDKVGRDKAIADLFKTCYINSIFEDNKFMYITVTWGMTDSLTCMVYNKNSSETRVLEGNVFRNDLDNGINFWPKQILSSNVLVNYYDAYDLLKRPLPSQLRGKIDLNSNPVLVLLK